MSPHLRLNSSLDAEVSSIGLSNLMRESPQHALLALPEVRGSASGRRLGNALLAYLGVMTLLITWAPLQFASRPLHGLTDEWSVSDLLLNVVMFLPLGFFAQSSRARDRAVKWWVIGLAGMMFSVMIEFGQMFIAERFTSVLDVVTNGLGAALGALTFDIVRPRLRLGRSTVSTLALELPLTGLVMLMVPLLWTSGFSSAGSTRLWLIVLLATFGGAVLGAVHGAYLQHTGRVSRTMLLFAVCAWFLVAALPGAQRRPAVLIVGSALALGCAWITSRVTSRARSRDGERRIELPTLRLVLPLFATYLVLSALWPLDAVDGVWRGAWSLAPAREMLSRVGLMQSLEYLAGMTLVGYITAELHGRVNAEYSLVSRRVLAVSLPLVFMLEGARGFNTVQGASAALAVLAILAGLFGGWLYHLQRDHVRTLLRRPVSRMDLARASRSASRAA